VLRFNDEGQRIKEKGKRKNEISEKWNGKI
jgi:hypothetical protein